ncbi:hypothetical protein [Streptomyces phaeoluteigriseus]|uniref:hypothetical protein n=1 Tax=Streptomyces phaeoluteigriseus TaxID=114686 RepID=UPI0036B247AF
MRESGVEGGVEGVRRAAPEAARRRVHVDHRTQTRTTKGTGRHYADIIRRHREGVARAT